MATLHDGLDYSILRELREIAESLQQLQTARLQHDLTFSTQLAAEHQKMLDRHINNVSELRVDHAIRRGEETVRLWQQYPVSSARTENQARAIRDKALAKLKKIEQQEKAELENELQSLTREAEDRKQRYIDILEKKRQGEDNKTAEVILKLSAGQHYPKNLLGQIVVVDKLMNGQFSLPKPGSSASSDPESTENDHSGIGFQAPSLEMYGLNPGNALPNHGLLTPVNTPPSSNEPRFGTLEQPATPTPVSRSAGHSSGVLAYSKLPPTFTFRQILYPTASKAPSRLPATEPQVVPATPASAYGYVTININGRTVIDLISDTEDEDVPPTKRRQLRSPSTSTSNQTARLSATSPFPDKTSDTKKTPKKQVASKHARKPTTPKTPRPLANTTESDDDTSPKDVAHLFKNVPGKTQNAVDQVPVRDTTPDIFDYDSEYSITGSRKRRNRNITCDTPRVRSGATVMGDLIDRPGAKLSSKGLAFWRWARLMYVPTKLIRFSVSFIRSHKDNGEVSLFNDSTSPVGMYLHRMQHTFVPVIGHARKEDIYPEFVIEERDIKYMQYSSEDSLVCVTKNGGEVYPDVLIIFVGRDDLWGFLVASKEEMGVTIQEK